MYMLLFVGGCCCFCSWNILGTSWMVDWKIYTLSDMYKLNLNFQFDWISVKFFGILLVIVYCVMKFSNFYMSKEKFYNRFINLVYLFVLSMCLLIFMPKFFFTLVGWDGLGFSSVVLVLYYSSFSSWSAGMKTYLIKRLGDSFLMISCVVLFNQGYWEMGFLKNLKVFMSVLLVLGFMTKSAQFPFSSWLPAAMAAPTPVSALVHSSTLVTAGIYLLMRFFKIFPDIMNFFIGGVGLWTLFSASFSACVKWDAKKIIAFSTLSQLGLMCYALSLGLVMFSFFHLLTHAVFKAMLFICVGFLIGKNVHLQDIRKLKVSFNSKILVLVGMFCAMLSLSGFPFLAGFWSKDSIIDSSSGIFNTLFSFLFLISLFFTFYYSIRLFCWLFGSGSLVVTDKFNIVYLNSIFPLFFLSCIMGSLFNKEMIYNSFCSVFDKFVICFILLVGLMCGLNFKKKFKSWFMWTISFIEPMKKYFFWLNFSKMGKNFFLADQSVMYSVESSLSKMVSNMSFFSLFVNYYFTVLSSMFYMSSGVLLLLVLCM